MNMPILQPIPIETRGKGFWGRLFTWFFSTRKWRVVEDFYYHLPWWAVRADVVIPKGFIFDGASIPRPLWGVLSPVGLLLVQGLIHDYAYMHDYLLVADLYENDEETRYRWNRHIGRKTWDKLFRDIGREVNGMVIINDLAYWALRIGGWMAWNAHRKREK